MIVLVLKQIIVTSWKLLINVWLFATPWAIPSMEFSRPEWSGLPFPSPGDLSNPGSLNPGLPHCRQILYQLSHKWSQRILEWVAYPFSRGSSQPRNQTRVSCIAGGFSTKWAIREAEQTKVGSWPCFHRTVEKLRLEFKAAWAEALANFPGPTMSTFSCLMPPGAKPDPCVEPRIWEEVKSPLLC